MAASVRSVGSFASGTDQCTPGLPTGWQEGDWLLIAVETGHTGPQTPDGPPSGYTQLAQGTEGTTNVAVAGTWYAKKATASESAPTIVVTGGNHVHAQMVAIMDVDPNAVVGDIIVGTVQGGATTTITFPGITTSEANMLVIATGAVTDNANDVDNVSGYTNGNISFTEHFDEAETTGSGGGVFLASGVMASAAATGDATATHDAAAEHVGVLIAFPSDPGSAPAAINQPHFRIRSDDSQGLNTDAGWAAALDTNATIDAETIFRVRFELDSSEAPGAKTFKLQYNRNAAGWQDVSVNVDDPATLTDAVEIVLSSQYVNDAATTNLLSGSSETFTAGVGLEDNLTPSITLDAAHTELEWALRLRVSYGDAPTFAGRNNDGDTFAFRVVESDGTVFTGTYVNPTVTLNVPAGLVGGTFVESPKFVGPVRDGNGNLYALIEFAETAPYSLMLKSTDDGATWIEADPGNHPTSIRDLESVDLQLVGHVIHILNTRGTDTWYQQYAVSTHATTPDTWLIDEETVDAPATGPADQAGAIVVRSDGTIVALWAGDPIGGAERIYYRIRSSGGTWGTTTALDTESSTDFTDVWAVLGENDLTHIFYADVTNGILYHRSLSSADSLSAREQVATDLDSADPNQVKPIVGAVYFDDAGDETIMVAWVNTSDQIRTALVVNDGTPATPLTATTEAVRIHGSQSDQAQADLAVNGTTTHLLYVDASTHDIWHRSNDGSGWSSATELVDAVDADLIRGAVFTDDASDQIYGFLYDTTDGYTGGVRWSSVDVTEAGEITGSGSATTGAASSSGSGSVEVTGSGSADSPAAQAAGTGDVIVGGSGAADLLAATASGSGSVPATGSGSADLLAASSSGSGSVEVTGSGAADVLAASAAGSSTVEVTGSGAADAPAASSSGSGDVIVEGAGAADLAAARAAGTGSIGDVVTGSGSATTGAASAAGVGTVEITAGGFADLAAAVASGSGDVLVEGTGSADLLAASAAGAGGVEVTGSGSADLAAAFVAGNGSLDNPAANGSGSADLAAAHVDGAGTVEIAGSGSADVPAATSSGAGGVEVTGSGAADAPAATVSGTGNIGDPQIFGSGAATLAPAVAAGSGSVEIAGSGVATSAPAAAAGSGSVAIGGDGAALAPAAVLAGIGGVVVVGAGSADLAAAMVAGTGGATPFGAPVGPGRGVNIAGGPKGVRVTGVNRVRVIG